MNWKGIYLLTIFALTVISSSNAVWDKEPDWLHSSADASSNVLTRHPRFLVFTNTGIIKLQFQRMACLPLFDFNYCEQILTPDDTKTKLLMNGFGIPVELRKRTLVWLTNLQFQYFTPVNYSQLFPMTINKKRSSADALSVRALDRTTIYEVIRLMLERKGIDGRACLMRAICETADTPLTHNGLVGEVMHVLFTPDTTTSSRTRWRRGIPKDERPGEDSLDEEFYDAQFKGEVARRKRENVQRIARSAGGFDGGSTFTADVCRDGFPSCPSSILDMVSILLEG